MAREEDFSPLEEPPGPSRETQVNTNLLDGVRSRPLPMAPELEDQKRVASDPTLPLDERLEALEDITDSEVGDTSLTRARNLERHAGFRQIYLKFEGVNPTGTQKDRISFAHAMDAVRRGFDAITCATCGNYGVALSLAASMAGLRTVIYIPEHYRTRRVKDMTDLGAEIVRVPGDYEAAVYASIERAADKELYDANPGGANVSLQLVAYGQIAYEIYDELRDAPLMVAAPVSNGTTLAGIYRGFLSLYRRGKTSRIPHMVAGSAHNKNPIVRSFLKGLPHCEDLTPARIKETLVNEPLINWHSIDGEQALDAIRDSGGFAGNATDKSMLFYSRLLRNEEGLNVLPASTAGLNVLIDRHKASPLTGDRYVVILTGRR